MDEPTDLPEGTVAELFPSEDELIPEERAQLNAALLRAWNEPEEDDVPAEEFLKSLRKRK